MRPKNYGKEYSPLLLPSENIFWYIKYKGGRYILCTAIFVRLYYFSELLNEMGLRKFEIITASFEKTLSL